MKQEREKLKTNVKIVYKPLLSTITTKMHVINSKINDVHRNNLDLTNELKLIKNTQNGMKEFDKNTLETIDILEKRLKNEFELDWKKWNCNDIIAWFNTRSYTSMPLINRDNTFKQLINGIKQANLNGKDLISINDLILRSFNIDNDNNRHL